MHVAAAQLEAHLQRGLRSLYTVHGDDALLVQEACDAIRRAARAQGHSERTVYTVSGAHFDWSEVLAAGSSLSLFADRQILEVRIPGGKPGKEGAQALQALAESAPGNDCTLTLVLLPRADKTMRATAWFAALEASGALVQVDTIERAALPQWIAQRMQRQGQRVQPGEAGERTLSFFADRVEGNLLAAHQEVEKLALLYPPGELDFGQVERAVSNVARYDAFKLGEAMLAGQSQRVQRMLDGLQAEGETAVRVHFAIAEEIRSLRHVHEALAAGRPLPLALRENRIWGLRERLYERALPRLSGVALDNHLYAAHQVDGIVKGLPVRGWPAEPWQALHRLAQQLARDCANPPQPGLAHPRAKIGV